MLPVVAEVWMSDHIDVTVPAIQVREMYEIG